MLEVRKKALDEHRLPLTVPECWAKIPRAKELTDICLDLRALSHHKLTIVAAKPEESTSYSAFLFDSWTTHG